MNWHGPLRAVYFIELGGPLRRQLFKWIPVKLLPTLLNFRDGVNYWSELKTKTLKLLPKWIIGSSAEQAADKGPEEKDRETGSSEGAVAEGRRDRRAHLRCFWRVQHVRDVHGLQRAARRRSLSSLGPRRTAVDGRCPAQVFVLLILIGFREEVQMTKLYNIKNNDMLYFLLFSVVLIPFQFIADVFTLNSVPSQRQ